MDAQPELIAQLSQEVYANDILQLLVLNIWRFEFEVSLLQQTVDVFTSEGAHAIACGRVGEKGCVTDFQSSTTETDWESLAYC